MLHEASQSFCDNLPSVLAEIRRQKQHYLEQFDVHRRAVTRARMLPIGQRVHQFSLLVLQSTWAVRGSPETVHCIVQSLMVSSMSGMDWFRRIH